MDADLEKMARDALVAEVLRLRAGIRLVEQIGLEQLLAEAGVG